MKRIFPRKYFSKSELILWGASAAIVILFFGLFDRENYLTLFASLIGVSSLIFNAKGNPFGQILMIVFSLIYGYISFHFSYYGEMITYIGMTLPMSVIALVSWLRHPYEKGKSEVAVNRLKHNEYIFIIFISVAITIIFYYILAYFNTTNIVFSTISVLTSFIAVYLTFRRSPYYAIGYAANDIVLIIMWIMACFQDISYISVVACFTAFFANDIYGFINWKKMQIRQQQI